MGVERVLVIILAIGFGLLLILSIALVAIIISIMRSLSRIAHRAEETTENFNEIAKMLGKRLAPAALSALAAAVIGRWRKSGKGRKHES